jgi:hypothetical protein
VSDTTIGWMILFGSVCVAALGLVLRHQFRKQYRWSQVPAVIIESTVRLNGEAFDAVVRFEYSWQGRRFVADTLRSGTISFNWRGPADRLRARFPVGTGVIAYVNERDPRSAVLEPGGDKWMLPFALSIAAFMAACAIVIIRIGK